MFGECHCLSEYTGQNCELHQDTTTMPNPMSSRTALIVGSTVAGSVLVLSLLIVAGVVIVVLFYITKVHKTRQGVMRISPSQQFQKDHNESPREKVDLEPSAPPYEHAQLPCAETKLMLDSEKSCYVDLEYTKRPPV